MGKQWWLSAAMITVLTLSASRPISAAASKVVKNSFLTTKRTIKTTNSSRAVKLTIPKATTVLVSDVKLINGQKYVSLNLNRLDYRLRKPLLASPKASRVSRWILAKGKNFGKTPKPKYLAYYALTRSTQGHTLSHYVANGDLWRGTTLPAAYAQQTGTRLTITTNGYLETFTNSAFKYLISPKPTGTIKIQKTVYNRSAKRLYLYFKSRPKMVKTTKVTSKGSDRYRLVIQKTAHTTSTAIPDQDNATRVTLNEIYQVGGEDYYMYTESAGFLGADQS
ncbi:hypothetical protein [Lentilactobacillus farraginis]|uniref:Uncharacterized protein n=1 Tax=Lentilactobacillus farraginis DSM 18382 = JCM 14108 TaxID=1423743 RepID=X0QC01_9LACO|nr:hypothetical protein [Lentilactobacillus farraginis]KRM11523.1 hypothetical protein FD41_GL001381 [Lentilactobacillus farraginis DSM 18382 = JCM 14108]GAF36135.1 hypothetical protein JCM14108_1084 [Lentilactobacillus farraginis DSM 18382 = JCM 14108]